MKLSREFLHYPEFWHDILPRFHDREEAIDFLAALLPRAARGAIKSLAYAVGLHGECPKRRPQFWSWEWPCAYPGHPTIPGLPERLAGGEHNLALGRRSARARAILASVTPAPEVKRPSATFQPPVDVPRSDVTTDATGSRLGQETESRRLDPIFETHAVPRNFEDLAAGFIRAQNEKKLHDQSQRKARIDMRHVEVPVLIFLHTDVHWGSEDTDYDAIRRHHKLMQLPHVYAFGGGDFDEFAKLKHRGAVDGQIHAPTVQARAVRSMFLETWEHWLAVTLGNHDMRVWLESGFDIGEYLLGEPPEGKHRIPFLRDGGLIVIEHGSQVYTHNLFHGDSAFGTRFNENHKGRQTARLVDGRCDATWNGHTHNPAIQDTNEPCDDMGGARDACYLQGGTYKVLGDDHAVRRKFLMVEDVQMPAVIQFPDLHMLVPFKRVEAAVMVHRLLVDAYTRGQSVRDVMPHLLDR
jgi:hypothetical protein